MIDAASLLPSPEDRNAYSLAPVKQACVAQLGLEAGFKFYRSAVGLRDSVKLVRKELHSLKEFAALRGLRFTEVFPSGEYFSIEPPRTAGIGNQRRLSGTARSFYVACVRDATVLGTSEIVQTGGIAALDFEGNELSATPGQLEVDSAIFHDPKDGTVWMMEDAAVSPFEVDEAFGSLWGLNVAAFGHWMWQYLPKYLTAVASGALPAVPVLISSEMPKTHREALELLAGPAVEIIEVSAFRTVRVRSFWCSPTLMYMPVTTDLGRSADHLAFPAYRFRPALGEMAAGALPAASEDTGIDRLYLARRGQGQHRRLVNRAEIEAIAVCHGFGIIYPEELAFADQVRHVRHAKYILGPDGSAIFLAYFARSGAKLCCLSHPNTILQTALTGILRESGVGHTLFTGPVVHSNDQPGYPYFGLKEFADYELDAEKFASFLDDWLSEE